jgi:hypothetical protein
MTTVVRTAADGGGVCYTYDMDSSPEKGGKTTNAAHLELQRALGARHRHCGHDAHFPMACETRAQLSIVRQLKLGANRYEHEQDQVHEPNKKMKKIKRKNKAQGQEQDVAAPCFHCIGTRSVWRRW